MRAAALILAALIAAPAAAETRVASNGRDEVRVTDTPCTFAGVLMHMPEGERKYYQRATARIAGQSYFACWREVGNVLHLWYEDGDQGIVPVRDLKAVPEA